MPTTARHTDDLPRLASDKYVLERLLGRGGMGAVFEARHVRLDQRVAIKILGEDLRDYPELVARFEREARAAGALSSPHAVRVFDIDQTEDGAPFMVMELIQGRDLADVVEQEGAQPVGVAVRWIIEACDAIAEAHGLGIIHRDIKPSNLLLCDETGTIKVVDFGIAKRVAADEAAITQGVAPLGTPQYMSPEQVRCAKDVDGRTDVWALGVTLFELVCGRPPFDHDAAHACVAAIVADPVPDPRAHRPELPRALADAILRALAKDREERFGSVEELVLALAPFAEPLPSASGAHRAVTAARRTASTGASTLDGGDVVVELVSRARGPRAAQAPRAPLPPSTPKTKRLARRLALGCAAALAVGVGGLLSRGASPLPEARQASMPLPLAAAVAKASAAPASPVTRAAARLNEAIAQAGAGDEDGAVGDAVRSDGAKSAPRRSLPPPSARAAAPAHGGLSSPGF